MREALLQVKEELGPEALILRTQKIKGSLLGGTERWEVTAGLEDRFFAAPERDFDEEGGRGDLGVDLTRLGGRPL